jgi:surfeit locus 1 family protein
MTKFQPRLWPTVITFVMLAILIGLGSWQLERRAWKTELLATIAERMDAPPVELEAGAVDRAAWVFRNVTVSGHFADVAPFHLYGRTHDGKAGVHLIAPLIRDDGSVVLIDRGFVPFLPGGALADYRHDNGPVTVNGVVREPEPAGWFLPDSKPAQNIWYAVEPNAMAEASHLALATPLYIAQRPNGASGWPAATVGSEGTGIRNEHLNYAIFWYSMAVALIVIYFMSSMRRARISDSL